jgi:mannose-6-phosphate isomerase-like protein (cupin superfamily)
VSTAVEKRAPLAEGRYRSAVRTPYQEWVRAEGVPLVETSYVRSLAGMELGDWPRLAARGAYINHDDSQSSNDCYVLEIAAGRSTAPEHHLFEEMVFVLSGEGSTEVWWDEGTKAVAQWRAGSLFGIPLNAWHRHTSHGPTPARLFGMTAAPVIINALGDTSFIFGCGHRFTDRFDGDPDHFRRAGRQTQMVLETELVPDLRTVALLDYSERGAGSGHLKFRLAKSTTGAHVSEFGVGTYKKAHRHDGGAHVVILGGRGYSLMWREGEAPRRFDWEPGTLIVPGDRAFHQHFNTSAQPVRYLAMKYKNSNERAMRGELPRSTVSVRLGGDQMEYEDEDPKVRELFLAELAKSGVAHRMAEHWGA